MADPPMTSAMATTTPPAWSILNTFTTDPLLSFISLRRVRPRADARAIHTISHLQHSCQATEARACTQRSVTVQPHAHVRFRRAIERRAVAR